MTLKKAHLAIMGITAINYLMMVTYATPILLKEAAGLWPFDIRITGYNQADAVAYLAAISEEGRQFYLITFRMLDTFFPALFAISLMVALYRLAPKLPVLFLTPLAGALFDYYENAAIGAILRSEVPDAALVEMASLLTGLKFASIALSALIILLLWQRRKP